MNDNASCFNFCGGVKNSPLVDARRGPEQEEEQEMEEEAEQADNTRLPWIRWTTCRRRRCPALNICWRRS